MECEILLSILNKLLDLETTIGFEKIMIIEIYRGFLTDALVLRSLFKTYDLNEHSTNIILDMINTLGRNIAADRLKMLIPNIQIPPSDLALLSSASMKDLGDQYAFSAAASAMKLQW
jgi:hypothetical protein